ncbi:MAG: riboflavin biosynthesis protein RibF [Fimbriimonadales bacterium]
MQTVFGLETLSPGWAESTVCIGVFDGVHLGHQSVIRAACDNARANSRPAVAVTFDRNPLAVLRPERCPKTILGQNAKLAKIAALGIDLTLVTTFDKSFSQMPAQEFLENELRARICAKKVVVGHDFALGKDRVGTAAWLSERIPTEILPPLEQRGRRVSSTEIRKDVAEGQVAEAAALLGGPYELAGIVAKGQQLGKKLGIPTANIVPIIDQVIPKDGIYACFGTAPQGRFQAAVSLGTRPAIEGAGFAIEAHLLDFPDRDLYGRFLSLEFVARLRDELWFDSHENLVAQIRLDIENARETLEERSKT